MPAKKKPAPKAPAKAAKKPTAKPAVKKPVAKAPAKVVKKAPAKPEKKAPAKAVKKAAAKPAVKKSPPVKKTPSKPAAKKPAAPAKAVKKPAPAKKPAAKPVAAAGKKPAPATTAAAKKPAPAKAAGKKEAAKPVKQAAVKETPAKKTKPTNGTRIPVVKRDTSSIDDGITLDVAPKKPVLPASFLKKQRQRLVELRDAYMNSAEGVTSESLRNHESGDASAFGMHQADAGSDAYDRDFALSLLAKEQDAIYEINEALNRIDRGTYGICEMSGNTISEERLEALPFTRFTVECQARIERDQRGGRWTRPVRSLFGLDESADDSDDSDDDDAAAPAKSKSGDGNESLDFGKE